ncbi:MAG: hypothetical protein RLN70_13715, partial [Rhodospirillaceae bacterium]
AIEKIAPCKQTMGWGLDKWDRCHRLLARCDLFDSGSGLTAYCGGLAVRRFPAMAPSTAPIAQRI